METSIRDIEVRRKGLIRKACGTGPVWYEGEHVQGIKVAINHEPVKLPGTDGCFMTGLYLGLIKK